MVDDGSRVVDIDDVEYFDLAHRDIDFDFSEADSEGIGVVGTVVGLFGRDVVGVGEAVTCLQSDVGDR